MTQSIFFDVIARDKASSTFSKVGHSSDQAESRLKKFGSTTGKLLGLVGGIGIGAGLVSFLKDANAEAREAQKVGALTNQVIKTTGGVAGITADQVGKMATRLSNFTGVDDEAIQSGENLLLTFTNIRNEVGGRFTGTFDSATKTVVDMSAALGQDMKSSAIQVGKALNDPIKGVTALSRVGVSFTAQQKEQIKTLVESGKTTDAQRIILRELKKEFGGAAKAQVTAGDKARVAWKNLEEQIGTALLPTVDKLATFMTDDLVPAVSEFVSGMQDGTGAGGDFVDMLKDAASVGKSALQVLDAIPGPVKKLAVEGLIAYGVLRKLQGATSGWGSSLGSPIARTKQFYAELTYAETRMQKVSQASYAMGGAIRNAAGTGGMLLLASSASASNKSTATLMQTLGGAATGFAVGGPIGAAVGGLAGLMLGLSTNTRKAGESAADSSALWKHYADTLDDVTAAQTKATTAAVQETVRSKGLNKVLGEYGFTNRQIVQAITKGGPLRQRMITDLKAEGDEIARTYKALAEKNGWSAKETVEYAKSHKARADAIAMTLKELGAVSTATAKKREDIAATRTFTKALKELPSKVETYVRTNGLKPGISGVVELARQIKLTPKEIRLLIRENGGKPTDAMVKLVQDRAIALGKLAPVVNVSAKTGQARAELGSFSKYLTEVTRPRTVDIHTRTHSGKPGGVGGLLGQTTGKSGRTAGSSERALGDNMRKAATETMSIKRALSKFGNALSKTTDELSSLKDLRQGFLDTFKADSIFGADLSDGGGIGSLLAMQQKQADQAAQLMADIQTVAGMGLSKSLISQLQAQGTSGAQVLHALAGGSAGQIQQFNALDAQTQSSLQAAGMFAGNTVRGGNVDSDIAKAKREEALLDRLVKRLEDLQDGKYIVVEIEGEQIVKAIKRRNKRKGLATAGV